MAGTAGTARIAGLALAVGFSLVRPLPPAAHAATATEGASAAVADRRDAEPVTVDTVRVAADRFFPEDRISGHARSAQAIPIEPSVSAASDLADLLTRGAGLQIRRTGGLGSPAMVSLRGFQGAMLRLSLDGTPIAASVDGRMRLDAIPLTQLDRIEVARDDLSLRLVSSEDVAIPLRLRIAGGSFGTFGVTASGVEALGPMRIAVGGGRLQTDGDYAYLDRRGTPFNGDDDRLVRRSNNAFRQDDGTLRATYDAGGGTRWSAWTQVLSRRGGVPGTESVQTKLVSDTFRRWLAAGSFETGLGRGARGRLSARNQDETDRYRNPAGEAGLGASDYESRFVSRGVLAALDLAPTSRITLRSEAERTWDDWDGRDHLRGSGRSGAGRVTDGVGGAADLRAANDRIALEVAHRQDWARASDGRGVGLGTTRVRARFDASPRVSLAAGAARHGRMPSFVELYGRGGVQVGNDALVPETGESVDAGVTWRALDPGDNGVRVRGEVSVYLARVRDAIHWLQNSQRTSRPENLERTRTAGAEVLLRVEPPRYVTLCLTGTFTDARDAGPSASYHGKRLPHVPVARVDSELALSIGGGARIAHRATYESPVYRDRYNSASALRGRRLLHDLELSAPIGGDAVEAGVTVRNLTDVRSQDFLGFPLPGRSVLVHGSLALRRR